jgi:fluoride exporter
VKGLLLVAGGALGTYLRWWLGSWFAAQSWTRGQTLFGTFVINVSGSFLLGVAAVLILERLPLERRDWFLLVGTGFCGGYTTFSSFEWETFTLIRDGSWRLALAYVIGSVLMGFLAVWLAVTLVHAIWPTHGGSSP